MYDPTHLKAIGAKRKKLMAQIDDLRPELEFEIRTAAMAGVKQVEIMEMTGYSREMVRLASMSEEDREAEKAKRRK